jgi:hypothetical protein
MQKRRTRTSIRPVSAEDQFRDTMHRNVLRHEKRRREIITQWAVAALVVGVIAVGATFAFGRAHKAQQLPMTQFELVAKQRAAKLAAAKLAGKTAKTRSGASKLAAKPAAKKVVAKVTAKRPAKKSASAAPAEKGAQQFRVAVTAKGFAPSTIAASRTKPIVLVIGAANSAARAGFRIAGLDVEADNTTSTVSVNLGSVGAGTYGYQDYAGSAVGTLVVK